MSLQFTHPIYLLLLVPALAWIGWFAWKSDVQLAPWRRGTALGVRLAVLLLLILALAGLQWHKKVEGMNVFFLLDRSDSIPSAQQDAALNYVNTICKSKQSGDKAGVIVFGSEASIESNPNELVALEKIQAVVGKDRTDLAAALRLGTAALPETGQKRLVLLSDGNENSGDALSAVFTAKEFGVTLDAVRLGVGRLNDVSVQKLQVPSKLKKGQPFEVKIFVQADRPGPAKVRVWMNDRFMDDKTVELAAGKNLFTFAQTLTEPGFYNYDVQVDAPNDPLPQNNKASAFTSVHGDPRILVVSDTPDENKTLADALRSARLEIVVSGTFPSTLAEMQSYDSIFMNNLRAGDLGLDRMKLLESAVRDFGIGFVCIGGDQAFTAGGYRGTPLETTLPVSMELDSKKVLPSGAVVLIMHGMEFNNGNQIARDCAQGVLSGLGPSDEMGVLLWNGNEQWVFPLQKIGPPSNKAALGAKIAGMNQGDLGSFQNIIEQAHIALKKSTAHIKHIIIFSDGDPNPPSPQLLNAVVADRITLSTILISGHSPPDSMEAMAAEGKGRFYNVTSPDELPQVFIKESAVILKSAIYEDPFTPQQRSASEALNGIGSKEYPTLLGYVATSSKPRAETPLWTDKGDPLLAHWQYGLGRVVAFTSDAKARWASSWLRWEKYRQFWSQLAQWSLRRLENADFTTEVFVDKGQGLVTVEALDDKGNYRNFLNLQTAVVSPKGQRETVRLEQTGPGHYEARFPTREVGTYMLNLMDVKDGQVRGSQVVGASINYSPEFLDPEPNVNLLHRLVESGGGKMLDPETPSDNPFLHDRKRTFQPRDLWQTLLGLAVLLFTLDVGVRRIQIDRDEIRRAMQTVRRWCLFWKPAPRAPEADESLTALLARRDRVRSGHTAPATEPRPDLFRPSGPVTEVLPGSAPTEAEYAAPQPAAVSEPAKPTAEPASTTSRLLEAKRRAQHRKKP
jgi:uncharacterized membrane protein